MTLQDQWTSLRSRNEAGLIVYTMGGFPTVDRWFHSMRAIAAGGADFIEIGLPFSDPIADGPVIQAASHAALRHGVTIERLLSGVVRARLQVPIILMSYLNPLLSHGPRRLFRDFVRAGVSGLIVPDLPADGAGEWISLSRAFGVHLVFLAAPTSDDRRLKVIAAQSSGFVYCVSLTGTTGARETLPPGVDRMVRRLRSFTRKPIAVGFGVSTPDQVERLSRTADGVIVGSRIVRAVGEGEDVESLVRAFKQATGRGTARGTGTEAA
jgi:tryptophan synthase alpha chain